MHQPTAIWVHVPLETHGACVLPVLLPRTGGTQALSVPWRQLRPRSVCGFACCVHESEWGALTAWYVLCWAVGTKARASRILQAGGSTRRKATLTGAIA